MTPKASLFPHFYVRNGRNATQAAISAGYAGKTAGATGSALMKKPEIQEAIRREARAMLAEVDVARLDWVDRVDALADADIANLGSWDDEGNLTLRASADLPKRVTRTIREIRSTRTIIPGKPGSEPTIIVQTDVKLVDPLKAQELQGKFLGMLGDADQRKADEKAALSENGDERAKRILELQKALGKVGE